MTVDLIVASDRAGFLERLGKLSGQTTYREPGGGGGTPYSARMMTTENAMTLALSMAQRRIPKLMAGGVTEYVRDPRDIGPNIAYTIGTAVADQRERVVTWLAAKLKTDTGPAGRKASNHLNVLAQHCYELVAFGAARSKLPRRLPVCWDALRAIGVGWLWMQAEETIERAEYARKAEARAA